MTMKSRFSLLRRATANELIPGGVWYRKETNGSYSTVITSLPGCKEKAAIYREQLKRDSEKGLMFLRKDKPNYPLTETSELFFNEYNIMQKLIMYNKTKGEANKSHAQDLMKELEELEDGNYVVTIRSNDIKGNPRGKYFAILKVVATDTGQDIQDLHHMFKTMYNNGQSTNVFSSDQDWYNYINKVKAFIEAYLGVSLPDPRDMTYEQWMEIESQYNKSFKF